MVRRCGLCSVPAQQRLTRTLPREHRRFAPPEPEPLRHVRARAAAEAAWDAGEGLSVSLPTTPDESDRASMVASDAAPPPSPRPTCLRRVQARVLSAVPQAGAPAEHASAAAAESSVRAGSVAASEGGPARALLRAVRAALPRRFSSRQPGAAADVEMAAAPAEAPAMAFGFAMPRQQLLRRFTCTSAASTEDDADEAQDSHDG